MFLMGISNMLDLPQAAQPAEQPQNQDTVLELPVFQVPESDRQVSELFRLLDDYKVIYSPPKENESDKHDTDRL